MKQPLQPENNSTLNQSPQKGALTAEHSSLRELIAQILQYVNDTEDAIKLNSLADTTVLLQKGDLIRRMVKGVYRGYNLGA